MYAVVGRVAIKPGHERDTLEMIERGGIARVFSQAGGVGGRGGAYQGTGQTGFNINATANPEITTGINAGPSFYLNNSTAWQAKGLANTDLMGKGFVYPAAPAITAASQVLNTGNYLSNGSLVTASTVSFADFYLSGRAPEFTFWNFGFEHGITPDMTISVNYVGDQHQHMGGSRSVDLVPGVARFVVVAVQAGKKEQRRHPFREKRRV